MTISNDDEDRAVMKTNPVVQVINYDDREEILEKLNLSIDWIQKKALNGRVQDHRTEKVKIGWFKTLGYLCSVYNQVKKDLELENMNKEMKRLAEQIEKLNNGDK